MKSPFKFLDYFEDKEEDHESFFGREPEIERLYRLVNHHRLSLIYGPSGTGKTSLINCGLAKQFYATDWLPLYIKRQGNINDSLLNALKGRLQEEEQQLSDSEDVVKLIEELSIQHLCPVYLIFDQLEELYIYGGQEEQRRFTDQVRSIVDAGLPCRIILILREEYLGRLYAFEQQVPISYEKRLRIEPLMAPIVKQEVIAKSFALFKISLSEPGLMDRMLKNLTGLKQVIPLPYLQVYLDRLWNAAYREQVGESDIEKPVLSITPAIVDGLGPLEEVFAAYLMDQRREIQYSLERRFPACPEDFVRSLLDGLVTPEGTKRSVGIKREGARIAVQAPVPTGWDKVDSLLLNEGLHALATARLLRVEEESIELAHDSLAAVIDGQRSAEERELNLYRQQIQSSFKYFLKSKAYLAKEMIPFYEKNLVALALPEVEREHVMTSKAYWQEIDERELIRERKKRRWFAGFSLVALVLAMVALASLVQNKKSLNLSKRSVYQRDSTISEIEIIIEELELTNERLDNTMSGNFELTRQVEADNYALGRLISSLDSTSSQLVHTNIVLSDNNVLLQKTLNSIYFYNDSYGLAKDHESKSSTYFGFIDRNLNIKIPYKYSRAAPFENPGFARVSVSDNLDQYNYLIDTIGNEYLLPLSFDFSVGEIRALDLRSNFDFSVLDRFKTPLAAVEVILGSYSLIPNMVEAKNMPKLRVIDFNNAIPAERFFPTSWINEENTIEHLSLERVEVGDPINLLRLNNLKHLNLHWSAFEDCAFLVNSKKLKYLSLHNSYCCNFDFLKELRDIEELDIGMSSLTTIIIREKKCGENPVDLSSISRLKNLRKLTLTDIRVDDFSFIESLESIEELSIRLHSSNIKSFVDAAKKAPSLRIVQAYRSYTGTDEADISLLSTLSCKVQIH